MDTATKTTDLVKGLGELMLSGVQEQIDASIAKAIDEHKAKFGVRKIEVTLPDGSSKKLEGRVNPKFDLALKIAATGQAICLVGPAGTGKSYMAQQIAKALNLRFFEKSITETTTEGDLLGKMTLRDNNMTYVQSNLVTFYEEGGAFFLDEVDNGNPNALNVMNGALALPRMFVEARQQAGLSAFVKRHDQFRLIAAANTYMSGGSVMYSGRNGLDAAFTDRFQLITVDYDTELESAMATRKVCDFVWDLRRKIGDHGLRRVAGTRLIQKMATYEEIGLDWDTIKGLCFEGWSKDDQVRVGYHA